MGLFDKKDDERLKVVKDAMLAKFGSLGATCGKLKYSFSKKVKTAETDGNNVYINPDFFDSCTWDQKVFLMAHETMHVGFNHIKRMVDREGNMRNPSIWNLATDAVIIF